MSNIALSNVLAKLSPGKGFAIYGTVEGETDYDSNVVFEESSAKPAWSDVEAGKPDEQWVVVRAQRDGKLSSCDWTVLTDVPISDSKRDQWEIYRQSLRNITDQPDPFNITWPTPPQ